MKNCRRILQILLVFVMVFGVGLINNQLVKAEEGTKVYVYNTLGWENVYVHSWSPNSNAPEMTAMTPMTEENWYEFTFSKDMGSEFEFLFYSGEWQGFNQTVNMKIEPNTGVYYVIQAELSQGGYSSNAAVLNYNSIEEAKEAKYPVYVKEVVDETTAEEAATSVDSLTVYYNNVLGWEKAGINAWGDNEVSRVEMNHLGDGWFSYTFENPASDTFNFMFLDVDAFAAEKYGAGYQTSDVKELKVTEESVWIVPTEDGNLSDGIFTVKQDSTWPGIGEVEEVKQEVQKTKIYFNNTIDWEKVSYWAWTMKYTDQISINPWPGDNMEDLGNDWFIYELQVAEDFAILFNNGEANGTVQTADSSGLVPGKTYWFTVSDESTANASGMGGGALLEVSTEPKAGWPEGPKAEEVTVAPTTDTTAAEDDLAVNSNEVVNKEGMNPLFYIIPIVIIIGAVPAVLYIKKNKTK
jgi:hypothetical protein